MSVISSDKFHSRKRASENWLMNEDANLHETQVGFSQFCFMSYNVVQKCNDFFFSLYLTAKTTLMQDEMTYICGFTTERFPCCAFCWMQFILFSTPSISNKQHYLQDESTSRLMKNAESHYIYAKEFKRNRKVHAKRKEQNSSSVRVRTKVTKIKALIDWKERRDIEWQV